MWRAYFLITCFCVMLGYKLSAEPMIADKIALSAFLEKIKAGGLKDVKLTDIEIFPQFSPQQFLLSKDIILDNLNKLNRIYIITPHQIEHTTLQVQLRTALLKLSEAKALDALNGRDAVIINFPDDKINGVVFIPEKGTRAGNFVVEYGSQYGKSINLIIAR